MRIVIVGGGQVGSSLARGLAPGHEVFVIDHDPDVADVFQAIDVEFLVGSGTSEEVLTRAGIDRADVFVAATGLDEVNIVACALASRLGRPDTICLVSRAEFLGDPGQGGGLAAFGVHRVVWPEAQPAADIERMSPPPGVAARGGEGRPHLRAPRRYPPAGRRQGGCHGHARREVLTVLVVLRPEVWRTGRWSAADRSVAREPAVAAGQSVS